MAKNARNWKLLSGWEGPKIPGYPGWFLNILAGRGIKDKEAISNFIDPSYESLPDPAIFQNIDRAVELLAKAKT